MVLSPESIHSKISRLQMTYRLDKCTVSVGCCPIAVSLGGKSELGDSTRPDPDERSSPLDEEREEEELVMSES